MNLRDISEMIMKVSIFRIISCFGILIDKTIKIWTILWYVIRNPLWTYCYTINVEKCRFKYWDNFGLGTCTCVQSTCIQILPRVKCKKISCKQRIKSPFETNLKRSLCAFSAQNNILFYRHYSMIQSVSLKHFFRKEKFKIDVNFLSILFWPIIIF